MKNRDYFNLGVGYVLNTDINSFLESFLNLQKKFMKSTNEIDYFTPEIKSTGESIHIKMEYLWINLDKTEASGGDIEIVGVVAKRNINFVRDFFNDLYFEIELQENLKGFPEGIVLLIYVSNVILPIVQIFDLIVKEFNGIRIKHRTSNPLSVEIDYEKTNRLRDKTIMQQKYKWWPISDDKKNRWRDYYTKVKPLKDKGYKNYEIAKKVGINRHYVTQIITWHRYSSEAHGK